MITLKKIRIADSLSEETLAFTADVYWNGRKIGVAENRGNGGCSSLCPLGAVDDIRAANLWARQQPHFIHEGTQLHFEDAANYAHHLACKDAERKDARKLARKAIAAGSAWLVGETLHTNPVPITDARMRPHIESKYPSAKILSGLTLDEATQVILAAAESEQ